MVNFLVDCAVLLIGNLEQSSLLKGCLIKCLFIVRRICPCIMLSKILSHLCLSNTFAGIIISGVNHHFRNEIQRRAFFRLIEMA